MAPEDIDMDEDVVWRDASGRPYRMSEIDDRHLHNIIRFLERQADAAEAAPFLTEHANDAADSAAAHMRAMAEAFLGEAVRRGVLSLGGEA